MEYSNYKPRGCYETLLDKRPPYTELLDRRILSNTPDYQLCDNRIETSKYNLITFLPFNLMQQLLKPSNIYFIFIGVMQMIKVISVSDGKPVMFVPLSIVILVSMLKDFIEDWRRHISDRKENQSSIEVLTTNGFEVRLWESIRVGDVIRVNKDGHFPCDVLLLQQDKNHSVTHIETTNLDGETNLKLRSIPMQLINICSDYTPQELFQLRLEVTYEKPNPFLSTFNGHATYLGQAIILQNANIILRGCQLKMNQFVVGLCLYNGHESKILLNSGKTIPKVSKLEKSLNKYFKLICGFQLCTTFLSALAYGLLLTRHTQTHNYIVNIDPFQASILAWGSWFISFSNLIPISLLVTVQMVRVGQGYFLSIDEQCNTNGVGSQVQTSSLNEELGQIKYVLTDKTGTLTKNIMNFKCLMVDNRSYGDDELKQQKRGKSVSVDKGEQINCESPREEGCENSKVDSIDLIDHVDFSEQARLLSDLSAKPKGNIHKTLELLSISHNIVVDEGVYNASSPDELALVNFASSMGYTFVGTNAQNEIEVHQTLNGMKKIKKWKLLQLLEFNSNRKRMSVIVERDNNIKLLIKGADEVILPRLAATPYQIQSTKAQLRKYASKGLRTLVLAEKSIPREVFTKWEKRYKQSLMAVNADRNSEIEMVQNQIEGGLTLLGVTAVEDKLQDSVNETITALEAAGIKIWMLTGDKKQTAISIGYSCGLITNFSYLIELDEPNGDLFTLLKNIDEQIHNHVVVICTGEFLEKAEIEASFLLQKLLKRAESAIFCRVSPKDKEKITRITKNWDTTLAIGDGANDVNMINTAHVGVGVRGVQGSQATRAADYIVGQFRMLNRLVLYYGINYYHRNATVMHYTIYRNILVALPIIIYGWFSLQSAFFCYNNWIFQFYNIVFVSFPIVYFGLFDTKYTSSDLQVNPKLYREGQRGEYFNNWVLMKQMAMCTVYDFVMVITLYNEGNNMVTKQGYVGYQEWTGMTILAIVIIASNLRIYVISHQFSLLQGLLCLTGILSFYLIYFIASTFLHSNEQFTFFHSITSPLYWAMIIGFVFLILAPEIVQRSLKTIANSQGQCSIEQDCLKENKERVDIESEKGGYAFSEDQNRFKVLTPKKNESNDQEM